MLTIKKSSDKRVVRAFTHKLADLPEGVGIVTAELVPGVALAEGTAIGLDSVGMAHAIKTAKAVAGVAASATEVKVAKGSQFKAGDFIGLGVGKKAVAITAIDRTSNATFDVITLAEALGSISEGATLQAAAAAGSSAALKYVPVALVGESYDVEANTNLFINAVTIGQVKTSCIPPLSEDIKSALKTIVFI